MLSSLLHVFSNVMTFVDRGMVLEDSGASNASFRTLLTFHHHHDDKS